MHIHGVFFRVPESNGQKAIEQFTRDTVLVGPRESVTIGFVPEHPEIWLTHCQIQEHAEVGMMTTIEVKNQGLCKIQGSLSHSLTSTVTWLISS